MKHFTKVVSWKERWTKCVQREGDSLHKHYTTKFSTIGSQYGNQYRSGWWHIEEATSNLNGINYGGYYTGMHVGIFWTSAKPINYSFYRTEMMMRPQHIYNITK
ncbi:hypothetical protein LAZ67_3004519 [Cordylochernes scorpioides]|uniref:Fibrinogen C-terminal domain-containing protein n=1 Tax=Cordylochernes scorpioides TaxID=51811 RepID=A0ABY6K9F5_9ARAC|nr:hypothetical protein LAZ67_3004519 [Cordylochernes scorpioides]